MPVVATGPKTPSHKLKKKIGERNSVWRQCINMPTKDVQVMGTKKGDRTTTGDMAGPVQLNLGSEWVKTPILINDGDDNDDDDKLTRISKFRDRIEKQICTLSRTTISQTRTWRMFNNCICLVCRRLDGLFSLLLRVTKVPVVINLSAKYRCYIFLIAFGFFACSCQNFHCIVL
jgi:hypothetical protein